MFTEVKSTSVRSPKGKSLLAEWRQQKIKGILTRLRNTRVRAFWKTSFPWLEKFQYSGFEEWCESWHAFWKILFHDPLTRKVPILSLRGILCPYTRSPFERLSSNRLIPWLERFQYSGFEYRCESLHPAPLTCLYLANKVTPTPVPRTTHRLLHVAMSTHV